jgi:hypothetical protein
MKFKTLLTFFFQLGIACLILSCSEKKKMELAGDPEVVQLVRGEITLCGSGEDQFGDVDFGLSCSQKVRKDFNLATALLHSFEYTEAEKVFARILDNDPECVMALWGVAMCNFHPLWAPPGPADLQKGKKVIAWGRTIGKNKSSRESQYLEAIAAIYDQSDVLDYRSRLLKFEKASQDLYEKYPGDKEAAIFYALALGAAADPADKTFSNQRKAGQILENVLRDEPNHPGIVHYIIHNYDYPELADMALPAARKYASIAAASAHAQHMPSHIFIRLGLWDESIASNTKSVEAARCYAQSSGIKGHWDEELHGLDYLTYAYLQKADDTKALEQVNYLRGISEVFPVNFKDAYCFAAMPARFALERKDWTSAAKLKLEPETFPWDKFLWEKAHVNFARVLGAVHVRRLDDAKKELQELTDIHERLRKSNENYQANLVQIQIKASEAWIKFGEGKHVDAIKLMTEAALMEEATAKHPVTPGELLPARELLADMLLESGNPSAALREYETDIQKHPNRFNGLYGAGVAAERSGNLKKAKQYFGQLIDLTNESSNKRPEMYAVRSFLSRN